MNITKVTIILREDGTDLLSLETDLPSNLVSKNADVTTLALKVTRGLGVQYAKNNFPNIPKEVIDIENNRRYLLQ